MGFLIGIFIVCIPCGFYAAVVAGDKGRGSFAWFFGGLIFVPTALVAAAGLGDRQLRRYQRFQAEAQGWPVKPTVTFEQKRIGKNDLGAPTHRSRSWTSWMTPWIQTRTAEVTAGKLR